MDLGWVWGGFGVGLGWVWGGFGVGLGWVWGGFGVGLGWVWGGFGVGLGWVWGGFGVGLALVFPIDVIVGLFYIVTDIAWQIMVSRTFMYLVSVKDTSRLVVISGSCLRGYRVRYYSSLCRCVCMAYTRVRMRVSVLMYT